MRARRAVRWTIACVLLAGATYVTATELLEAYGAGAPFYGRSTNMDKWTSPWPLVATVDALALALIALLLRPRRRSHRR